MSTVKPVETREDFIVLIRGVIVGCRCQHQSETTAIIVDEIELTLSKDAGHVELARPFEKNKVQNTKYACYLYLVNPPVYFELIPRTRRSDAIYEVKSSKMAVPQPRIMSPVSKAFAAEERAAVRKTFGSTDV